METIDKQNDFIQVLEKLATEKKAQGKSDPKILEEFDFQNMFMELEEILKKYQKEHSRKSSESELELAELTLTT